MKITEITYIKCMVNLKCIGHFGATLRPFPKKVKGEIIDELIARGWLDEHCNILPAAKEIILANLSLLK